MKNIDFGNYLYQLRKDSGLTQRFVAYQLDVTDKAVSKWEMGKSMPDVNKLNLLASLYNVSLDELLNMDKEHVARMKELNERLKYLLSIEKLNENQEDSSNYINTLLGLVDIKLIDTISLEEIERVRSFQSEEIPKQEMQLSMKK